MPLLRRSPRAALIVAALLLPLAAAIAVPGRVAVTNRRPTPWPTAPSRRSTLGRAATPRPPCSRTSRTSRSSGSGRTRRGSHTSPTPRRPPAPRPTTPSRTATRSTSSPTAPWRSPSATRFRIGGRLRLRRWDRAGDRRHGSGRDIGPALARPSTSATTSGSPPRMSWTAAARSVCAPIRSTARRPSSASTTTADLALLRASGEGLTALQLRRPRRAARRPDARPSWLSRPPSRVQRPLHERPAVQGRRGGRHHLPAKPTPPPTPATAVARSSPTAARLWAWSSAKAVARSDRGHRLGRRPAHHRRRRLPTAAGHGRCQSPEEPSGAADVITAICNMPVGCGQQRVSNPPGRLRRAARRRSDGLRTGEDWHWDVWTDGAVASGNVAYRSDSGAPFSIASSEDFAAFRGPLGWRTRALEARELRGEVSTGWSAPGIFTILGRRPLTIAAFCTALWLEDHYERLDTIEACGSGQSRRPGQRGGVGHMRSPGYQDLDNDPLQH